MIFVSVGHSQGFLRLVKKMDEIAGEIEEKVIMQIGHTKYCPRNSEFFDFETYSRMEELSRDARIVISHAGVGSILTALKQGTPIIVVPRLKKYGEIIDDHQLEISEALAGDPRIVVVYDIENLEQIIRSDIKSFRNQSTDKLANAIKTYLSSIC